MKKIILMLTVFSFLAAFLAVDAFAQPGMRWRGGGGWGPDTQYGRLYDPKSLETISGEVVSIDRLTPYRGMRQGLHMTVKTDKETLSVHLGPSWYVEFQDVKILPKDKVEIKGSRIVFGGKPTLIAAEVKKGDQVLKLRDENGYPVWSGWRRR